jgi:FkbM family methyltransferase
MRRFKRIIRAIIELPIRILAVGLFRVIRSVPRGGVAEKLVQTLSSLIRCVPENRITKAIFIQYSLLLRERRFNFRFRIRHIGISWTASAFPDSLTRHMMFEGMYQEDVLVALRSVIHGGDTIFDVGGHHGLMAIICSIAAGETGTVVTFEPNPYARLHLRRHLALNDVRNVVVEEIALSDKSGTSPFYVQKGDVTWNSTIIRGFASADSLIESITVRTVTLDDYIAESQVVPNVVKIDVEGAEFLILNGAKRLLREHKPVLIMEFNPLSAQAAGHTVHDYVEFLVKQSYRLFVLKSNVLGYYKFGARQAFDEACHTQDGYLANVICVPNLQAP